VLVSNGSVPNSTSVTFHNAGTYYWAAFYSGDANNKAAVSDCSTEQLVVTAASPAITTQLSAGTIAIDTSANDTASLTGASQNAGGLVDYRYYSSLGACLADSATAPTGGTDVGSVPVTNGSVPASPSVTFHNAGTYYWAAYYSGDTNNNPAASGCNTELLVVSQATPNMSTAQTLLPNDSSTISGASGNAGGTVTFNLYSPSDASCSSTPAYTQTVNVSGSGTYATTNTAFLASAVGTWRWKVVYSGDSNNVGTTSACGVENFTITNG
jgi:hypothetical protein